MHNRIFGALIAACLPACLLISPLDEATPDWGYTGSGGSAGAANGGSSQSAGSSQSGGSAGSSSAGSSGASTSGGSGGGNTGPHTCGDPLMIDDFEAPSHESAPCATDGRNGGWYLYTDGSGTSTPPPSTTGGPPFPYAVLDVPRTGSTYGVHVTASGQREYGGLGFSMRFPSAPYDATGYSGISFWARGQGSFRVTFPTPLTRDQTLDGGECVPDQVRGCNDHFGSAVINLTSSWEQYSLHFADQDQQGWGIPAFGLVTAELLGIEFVWTPGTFEFWLDDLKFLPAECTDYESFTCPAASSINFCSYGAPTTVSCPELCAERGFSGGNACDPSSGCNCGATLDSQCEAGAVFVCDCLESINSPCQDNQLFYEYYGCYRSIPEWDYVRCFAPYAANGTDYCVDAFDACL
jgi:hypothetical protein